MKMLVQKGSNNFMEVVGQNIEFLKLKILSDGGVNGNTDLKDIKLKIELYKNGTLEKVLYNETYNFYYETFKNRERDIAFAVNPDSRQYTFVFDGGLSLKNGYSLKIEVVNSMFAAIAQTSTIEVETYDAVVNMNGYYSYEKVLINPEYTEVTQNFTGNIASLIVFNNGEDFEYDLNSQQFKGSLDRVASLVNSDLNKQLIDYPNYYELLPKNMPFSNVNVKLNFENAGSGKFFFVKRFHSTEQLIVKSLQLNQQYQQENLQSLIKLSGEASADCGCTH